MIVSTPQLNTPMRRRFDNSQHESVATSASFITTFNDEDFTRQPRRFKDVTSHSSDSEDCMTLKELETKF